MIRTLLRRKRPPVGARPGTLAIAETAPRPKIRLLRYDEAAYDEAEVTDLSRLDQALATGAVSWVDVQGMGDEKVLRAIAERFSIHPLALEDLVNGSSRPKAEAYDDHLLIVTRMVRTAAGSTLDVEQVGILVGQSYVLTFQERHGDVLEPIRTRVRTSQGPLRRSGAGYLAYAILDAIVDAYFPVVDALGEELENLEELVMTRPNQDTLARLNRVRGSLLALRRAVAPQRETANRLIRDDSPFIEEEVRPYLRDVYDHCIQTNEAIEAAREMANGLFNTYLSVVSNRTNEVMKVLTIVASIFVPLTFMAGIYGMNFEHIPELKLAWGYPALLAAMAIVALGMVFYFRHKGWIGAGDEPDEEE